MDKALPEIDRLIRDVGLPYFERFRSLEALYEIVCNQGEQGHIFGNAERAINCVASGAPDIAARPHPRYRSALADRLRGHQRRIGYFFRRFLPQLLPESCLAGKLPDHRCSNRPRPPNPGHERAIRGVTWMGTSRCGSELPELAGLNHLFQNATTGAVSEYGLIEETMAPWFPRRSPTGYWSASDSEISLLGNPASAGPSKRRLLAGLSPRCKRRTAGSMSLGITRSGATSHFSPSVRDRHP